MGDAILEQEGGQQQLKDVACVAHGNEREREREKAEGGHEKERQQKKTWTGKTGDGSGGPEQGEVLWGGRGPGGGFIGEINTGRVIFFLLLRFETAKCSRDGFCRNEII